MAGASRPRGGGGSLRNAASQAAARTYHPTRPASRRRALLPEAYQAFTRALLATAEGDPAVLGVVPLGSTSGEGASPDVWADHGLFLVVRGGEQAARRLLATAVGAVPRGVAWPAGAVPAVAAALDRAAARASGPAHGMLTPIDDCRWKSLSSSWMSWRTRRSSSSSMVRWCTS